MDFIVIIVAVWVVTTRLRLVIKLVVQKKVLAQVERLFYTKRELTFYILSFESWSTFLLLSLFVVKFWSFSNNDLNFIGPIVSCTHFNLKILWKKKSHVKMKQRNMIFFSSGSKNKYHQANTINDILSGPSIKLYLIEHPSP